ncbi:hypothetical protein NLJ89_g4346 [Agrocybe chaxingu]|uniref:F-box domain-containing protein n=1 Tax=Agrocybe chaxingu TaxID=84603 RepID=A0A9W8K476_9AGAR|nr:hypothetical protein NLJ89_g4346 [Agrocybe chaxingu]
MLGDQIAETRAFLEHLEAHRATLKPKLNASHDPFMSLLPTESASRILDLSIDQEDPLENRFPLVLASVSRRWRDIARSTPSLWTSLHLRLDEALRQPLYVDILEKWISRSAQLPLSLSIRIDYCDPCDYPRWELFKSVITILNIQSSRWGRLSLNIPFNLLGLFQSEIVSLVGCRFVNVLIDWKNVTCLFIVFIDVNACLEILQNAPQLRECRLRGVDGGLYGGSNTSPIVLQHLSNFDVEIAKASVMASTLFDRLIFPSLNSFLYSGHGRPFHQLTSFFLRSLCPIKFLYINEGRYIGHTNNLYALLRAIPTIEDLRIEDTLLFDQFFARLSLPNASDEASKERIFLPHLTSLYVRNPEGETSLSWSVVCNALDARSLYKRVGDGRPVLQHFYMEIRVSEGKEEYRIDKSSLEVLQRVIDRGVHVHLFNCYNNGASPDMIAYSRAYHETERQSIGT